MSAAWVAGSVRARALARPRPAAAAARELAVARSLPDALAALGPTAYGGRLAAGDGLAAVQRTIAAETLWRMRVLAGWLPGTGVTALRALAGWFEIANVEAHLRTLAGQPAEAPYRLGRLATAWPRLAACGSPAELRAALAASPWGDPGGDTPRDIGLGMRLSWADRVRSRAPDAAGWATAAVALLVARERFAAGDGSAAQGAGSGVAGRLPPGAAVAASRLIGTRAIGAQSLDAFAAALPRHAGDLVRDVVQPADLWRAEVRWWRRLRAEGTALRSAPGFAAGRAVGAVAVLAAGAWLDRAALELAARGGGPLEAFDAVT